MELEERLEMAAKVRDILETKVDPERLPNMYELADWVEEHYVGGGLISPVDIAEAIAEDYNNEDRANG